MYKKQKKAGILKRILRLIKNKIKAILQRIRLLKILRRKHRINERMSNLVNIKEYCLVEKPMPLKSTKENNHSLLSKNENLKNMKNIKKKKKKKDKNSSTSRSSSFTYIGRSRS
ncbi:hypothetical protein A6P53_02100 [Enterococcus hirae]|nr:hypothetical protein A6P53_02100 [Enterococcus hirae]